MKKCAFCKEEAVTGEHLWDNWINEELPKRTRFKAKKQLSLDAAPIEFVSVGLNEKLPVVCEDCNSGWMCDLTAKVKERFRKAILNNEGLSLGPRDAALLATFSFMKAAVKDYCYGKSGSFFTNDARRRLRVHLAIPPFTQMWLAAFQGVSRFSFQSSFNIVAVNGPGILEGMEFFSYTYITGNLAVQLLVPRWKDVGNRGKRALVALDPPSGWEAASTRFWPNRGDTLFWPPALYIDDDRIKQFVYRFNAPITIFFR